MAWGAVCLALGPLALPPAGQLDPRPGCLLLTAGSQLSLCCPALAPPTQCGKHLKLGVVFYQLD